MALTPPQCVDWHIEIDSTGYEDPIYRYALRWCGAEPPGRRRRMQSQGLVDDAVQVFRVLHHSDVEGLVRLHQGFQFIAQFLDVRWVPGEVVEDVREHDRNGITACDDEQTRVSMQPFGGFDVFLVLSRLQEPGCDVRYCSLDIPALIDLLIAPVDESPETSSHKGCDRAHRYHPWDWGAEAKKEHGRFKPVDGKVISPSFEHVETFPKGKIAHDVEGPVVEPC